MKRAAGLLAAAALVWSSACARVVALDGASARARNDVAWTVRSPSPATYRPGAPPVEDVTPVEPLVAAPVAAPAAAAASEPAATASTPPPPPPPPAPSPPPSPPVPSRPAERPEIAGAMATARDWFGIPVGLYAVDPLLVAYRQELDAQASARRTVGNRSLAFGLLSAVLTVFLFREAERRDGAEDENVRHKARWLYLSSGVTGFLSFGSLVAGASLLSTSSDDTQLATYYRETYEPRSP